MKFIYYFFILLTGTLATACSGDTDRPETPEGTLGNPVGTSLRIRTESGPVERNELIHCWWVAFVAPDNHIERIVRNTPDSPADEDFINLTIPSGKYTLVGFANHIPELNDDGSYTYRCGEQEITFREGEESPVTSYNASTYMYAEMSPEIWNSGALVPMSALQNVTVTGRSNEQIYLEMVRLVAKIEISFENIGNRDITINSVRIGNFKADTLNLFPDYDSLDSFPVIPSAASMLDVTHDLSGCKLQIAPSQFGKDLFYTRESSASGLPNDVYTIFINVTHHAGLGWNESTDEVSALLTDISYVNRNDHIIIPVQLSDYIIGIEANFYPPIGGYPAVVTEAGNGNYYAKFGSMGVFTIRPHVRKAVALDSPEFGELSNAFLNMEIFSVEGDDIYIQKPVLDANHDIIGQLGSGKGTSKVTLRFRMPQKDGSILNYFRTILIIRE